MKRAMGLKISVPFKSGLLICIRVFWKMSVAKGYQQKLNLMSPEQGTRSSAKPAWTGNWGKNVSFSKKKKQR